ncbi:putative Crp/Fnr-family transcriptional regulator [Calothrix brevissima NIES-22]|nr:putative Crp/Fnr-family transcriptional regulator [Calothrix brevissima NIES-22]
MAVKNSMYSSIEQRRKHKRVSFTVEENIVAICQLPNYRNLISAIVRDISHEGIALSFQLDIQNACNIQPGECLTIREIRGIKGLQYFDNFKIEIKWILVNQCIAVGCQFMNAPKSFQEQIRQLEFSSTETNTITAIPGDVEVRTNTWIVVSEHATSGILNTVTIEDNIHIISKQELQKNSDLKFSAHDKVCINSETVLDEVLHRMEDVERCLIVNKLKDKFACRQMLQAIYPDFYFLQIKLHDLPSINFDRQKKYFIKPIKGYWGSGIGLIQSGVNLNQLVNDISQDLERKANIFSDDVLSKEDFLIEEFIEGEEYAVDMYYSSMGEPIIINIYHHPIPKKLAYLHMVYYTSADIFHILYDKVLDFFTKLNCVINAKSIPIHAEFKYFQEQLIPVELNPLRYGSDGLSDLSYYGFGFNPFEYFAKELKPNWKSLWNERLQKVYAWYTGYNGTNIDVKSYRPSFFTFRQLFSHIISDITFNYHKELAFSVMYIEETSVDKIFDLLEVEFRNYFIPNKQYSEKSFWQLFSSGIETFFASGVYLWREGDLANFVFLVLQGSLEVMISSFEGKNVVIETISAGEIVGEIAALDGLPYSTTVITITDCTLIKIPTVVFRSLSYKYPELFHDIFWQQVVKARKLALKYSALQL